MEELTLTMPYYYKGERYHKLKLQATIGYVNVFSEDDKEIYSGYTVDAMRFINKLIEGEY